MLDLAVDADIPRGRFSPETAGIVHCLLYGDDSRSFRERGVGDPGPIHRKRGYR
jgi:hypothetical protein